MDASYFKVRSEGRYINKALLIVTGIHKNGCREILGAKVEANEDEPGWESLFEDLKGRGLKGVKLVVSDGHKAFPRQHWRRIRTTNGLERINKELKRRSRVAGAFSNDESLLRLAVCIVMDINEEWVTGRKYLTAED